MIQKQKRITKFFLAIFIFAFFVPFNVQEVSFSASALAQETPSTSAGFIPCGKRAGQGSASEPCTACHALVASKSVLDYLTKIMVVVAVAVIVAMGVLYILSGVNAGFKKTAKVGLTYVLYGLVLMLSAWLIVSTILRFLATPALTNGSGSFLGLVQGPGAYGLQCSTASEGNKAQLVGGTVTGTSGGGSLGVGSGSCAPITDGGNPCSVENIKKNPCWAGLGDAIVQQASGMCNAESRGVPTNASGTDHCGCATCPSVSGGLFQVNTTVHYSALGCSKPAEPPLTSTSKHSDGWYDSSCKVINASAVTACMNKTFDPAVNLNLACQLYKERGSWGAWNYSFTQKCNSFK